MIIILQLMNYGATIISIKVPSKNGLTDVVLGFDEIDGYLRYVHTKMQSFFLLFEITHTIFTSTLLLL